MSLWQSTAPGVSPAPLKPTSSAVVSISHIEHSTLPPPAKRIARTGASEEALEIAANGREPVSEDALPVFSPAEVAAHNSVERGICESERTVGPPASDTSIVGIVIEDRVYDVSSFVDIHPGGPEVFTQFAGHACTWQVSRFVSGRTQA